MKFRNLIGFALAIVIGFVLWHQLPGLRTRIQGTFDKAATWSEEARQKDPLGFIDYAEGRLQKHLASLKSGRSNIRSGVERIAAETERNQSLLAKAEELGSVFRTAFVAAENSKNFPVAVAGSPYSRPELIEQVRLVLLQRGNYDSAITGLAAAKVAAQNADIKLLRQLTVTQAALAALPAKKEIVRVNQLAGEVQTLLAQIDALIDENETVLEGTPVRTVEELLGSVESTQPSDDVDVMAFLKGASE